MHGSPPPRTTRPLRLTILGAGVAGLAAATLLSRDGHHVELLDERFSIPAVGTSLGLFGPAQQVLGRIGVLEAVRELSAAPERGTLRAADGRVLAEIPPAAPCCSRAPRSSACCRRRCPPRSAPSGDGSRTSVRCVPAPTC